MTYLTPKPRSSSAWIPGQVAYGIDCSDPDPEKWFAFGENHEAGLAEAAKHAPKAPSATPK